MKIKLIILALAGLPLSGCFNPATKLVKALAQDPATVSIEVTSIYGRLQFTRTSPGSNTLAHTVSPDGRISVTKGK